MGQPGDFSARPVPGLPEVTTGFDLGAAIADLGNLREGDIVAISQKVVSKAEGQTVDLAGVLPGEAAQRLASELDKDPRMVELILSESTEVVRTDPGRGIIVTATHHGFICANSGIDSSNVDGDETVLLLPEDPDASARRIRAGIAAATGVKPAVIISDSFGRAWRYGQAEVAIGCAGIEPTDDWRGQQDTTGRELKATEIAIADQIASAADLARDKTSGTPVVVVSGLGRFVIDDDGPGCVAQLRKKGEDLFR